MAAETIPHHHEAGWSNSPSKLRIPPRTTPLKKASKFRGTDPSILMQFEDFRGLWILGVSSTPPPKTVAYLRQFSETSTIDLAINPSNADSVALSSGARFQISLHNAFLTFRHFKFS